MPQLASIFGADEFRLYQLEDTALYDVRLAIQNGSKTISSDDSEAHEIFRQKDKLFIGNDGILRIKNFHSRHKCRNQLLVPKCLRRKVLQHCHDSQMSGHLGRDRTFERVRDSCFWPSMANDVSIWVRGCDKCNCSKSPSKPEQAPLQPHEIPERPFHKIAVDFCGPYVETNCGHKYVLQIQDLLTRYIMLVPTTDQTALTAAKAIVNRWICQFDIPLVLLSDHGPAFEANLFKAVCDELGIDKVYSTPYHPEANGQVERQNRSVNQSHSSCK
jgi:hypothetical protein